MKTHATLIICLGFALAPVPALANNDSAELWFNPSVSFDLDADTGIEIETAQRFRNAGDGRVDTYFGRIWLNQSISKNATLSGAIERRINNGGDDETRLIQQLSTSHGILRTRLRLEHRFVDNADQVGFRLRPRLGVAVPLDTEKRWTLRTDAELMFTLRSTRDGGTNGLTGLRTQLGVSYDINDRLTLSGTYLRQQEFERGAPDDVGHAPLIGIEYAF